MAAETEILPGSARFEPTRWSIILTVRSPGNPRYLESWNELVRLYWRPVYRSIRCRWNEPVESAKDLAQAFFAGMFESGALRRFEPERGRFRTFLKAALENFLRNARRDGLRLKRGGGEAPLPLDFADEEPPAAATDDLFEREWRRSVLEQAVDELGRDVRPEVFAAFRAYFLDPARPTYREVADGLRMSESDVTNHLHLAKTRLREIVRRLVRESTENEREFEDEMRELFGAP